MSEGTYSRENEIDATRASAHLPGLDIDIIHRQSPNGDWEQISINLRATPSFESFGHFAEVADPFTLWAQAARMMWISSSHSNTRLLMACLLAFCFMRSDVNRAP